MRELIASLQLLDLEEEDYSKKTLEVWRRVGRINADNRRRQEQGFKRRDITRKLSRCGWQAAESRTVQVMASTDEFGFSGMMSEFSSRNSCFRFYIDGFDEKFLIDLRQTVSTDGCEGGVASSIF